MNRPKAEEAIAMLLTAMEIPYWLDDPNFVDTPKRVAAMYEEMLSPPTNNWKTFPAASADLILLRNHSVVALCPHHLLPVVLKAFVAYIPNKRTLGLSKLARVVESHLIVPITQEDLAHRVSESLHEKLDPKGVGVVLAGEHGCMRYRGVKTDGDVVVSVMKGVFLLNPAARQELFQLIGRP
jgi:GTP cyclohydrolase I